MSLKFTALNSYLLFSSNFSWGKTRQITHVLSPPFGSAQKNSLRVLLLRQPAGLGRVLVSKHHIQLYGLLLYSIAEYCNSACCRREPIRILYK